MRFLDLLFECPVCRTPVVANEPGARTLANAVIQASLAREIGPYDKYAYYRGSVGCPGCRSRLGVSFRDVVRQYAARTEILSIRVLDADEGMLEL